jgi:signal transduction histidine kinase
MKIQTKLMVSYSIMAALAGVAGILAYGQITEVSSSFDIVKNKATPTIIALGDIKADFNAMQAAVLAFNLHVPEAATDPEAKQLALDHFDEVQMQKENLMKSFAKYSALEEDKAASNKIGTSINGLVALVDEMTTRGTQIMNGEQIEGVPTGATPEEEFMHLHGLILEFDEMGMAFTDDLNMKIEDERKSLEMTQTSVINNIESSMNLNTILTIGAVSVVFVVGGLAAHSITRRVSQLKSGANEVAAGRLSQQIATTGSDEITDLATNFEHMRKNLVAAQETLASKNKELRTLNADLELANEALKKLDKLKDQFIGIASHELRGPIHPILGYASMAKSGKVKPEAALDIIYKQALKLKQLAGDILDVSRIESGTLTYAMQKTKIHEILLNAMVAAGGMVNPKEVSVIADIDEHNKDLEIWADRDRIGQVFTNIIGNSTKFTKKGAIKAQTHVNKDANTVEISITDTGGGIPEDLLPNLFGKFVTKNIGNLNKEGSGLGLYISKAIVTAHGGTIDASNSGSGATFRIVLPIDEANENKERVLEMIKREHK